MTFREIFLQADPHIVNEKFCRQFVPFYCTQGVFDICKGLKLFAQGEIYDADEATEIEKIRSSGKKFPLTMIQAQVIRTGIKGYLRAALKALGINDAPNRDELVNQWLNREINRKIDTHTNINLLANNIIEKLEYERFKS